MWPSDSHHRSIHRSSQRSSRTSTLTSRVLHSRAGGGVIDLLDRISAWRPGRLATLTYHRVDDHADDRYPGLISADPHAFERQIEALAAAYSIVHPTDVVAASTGGPALPPRAVLLTFDDAVDDFASNAWPVLRDHGFGALLFVPTAFPDSDRSFWWDAAHAAAHTTERVDPLNTFCGELHFGSASERAESFDRLRRAMKQLPWAEVEPRVAALCEQLGVEPPPSQVLGWAELTRLASDGVTLAPHTRTHPQLDRVPIAVATDEIAGSIADLRQHIGEVAPIFAYPDGRHTDEVRDAVAAAGIRLAFTTERGADDLGSADPLRLHRINVSRRTGLTVARAQLNPMVRMAADRIAGWAPTR